MGCNLLGGQTGFLSGPKLIESFKGDAIFYCVASAAVAILGDTFRQRIDLKRTIQLTAFLLHCLCRVTYMRVFAARWSRTLGVRQFFKKSRAHVYSPFRRSNFGERKMFCFLACYSIIFPLLVTILTPETNQSQDQSV